MPHLSTRLQHRRCLFVVCAVLVLTKNNVSNCFRHFLTFVKIFVNVNNTTECYNMSSSLCSLMEVDNRDILGFISVETRVESLFYVFSNFLAALSLPWPKLLSEMHRLIETQIKLDLN